MSKRFYSREFTNFIDNPKINPTKVSSLFNSIINFIVGGIIRRWQQSQKGERVRKYSFT